ncbi:Predicted dithiol-disulfide isomerase, DsbA family [Devosia enhydra]|uniref:Predicted dithiol-disulfide isomerase, DsbA family n=1 Tax=Devosia enhydra TaxID=665118 RepID=A0A1K2HWW9_9HYPH|nr:DsbA family oxidoreductase [Devosia enhydra]SFZ83657.1 Predicted dithiol-disulfide isomerase, DsbA family [Devosia enhydra]
MATSLKIDVFTDIVCPWCLVGSARLDQAIARLGPDVTVDIENHPFYLDPNAPAEGVVVADMLRQKYGREPKEMWERVEGEARATGIALDLSKQPRAYPTARAHTLIRAARAKGTQHGLATAITEAYFLEHRQINDPDILAEIAIRFGFDRQEALQVVGDADALGETEDLALDAARQGINGVPFFIFQRRLAMSGCQPADVFDQALARALQESVPAA